MFMQEHVGHTTKETAVRAKLNKAKRMLTHARMLFIYDEDGPYRILYGALVEITSELSRLNRKHRLIRGRVMRHWCQDCITYERERYRLQNEKASHDVQKTAFPYGRN